ncbi:type II toxin-antitoxin system VapC family toxin [Okeania sp.]|uniref:type II toxin-antitoxin system VapC family toxin n=1 Tax=Okeania sp. TaxID=3100323 RepID=UPI002B4B36AA|nr:type II toxin-antitoxin system VapC family toxin [Okeania sp.]MEB3339729.1 type II toxin-antitoxin system VapC family toxin [Okeania sp.]
MTIYFLDSSTLVKRYISKIGSTWVLGLFDSDLDNKIFITAITQVEIIAAITKISRGGNISATDAAKINHQLRQDTLQEYQIIEITESIALRAGNREHRRWEQGE